MNKEDGNALTFGDHLSEFESSAGSMFQMLRTQIHHQHIPDHQQAPSHDSRQSNPMLADLRARVASESQTHKFLLRPQTPCQFSLDDRHNKQRGIDAPEARKTRSRAQVLRQTAPNEARPRPAAADR